MYKQNPKADRKPEMPSNTLEIHLLSFCHPFSSFFSLDDAINNFYYLLLLFSSSVMSDSLQPHEL